MKHISDILKDMPIMKYLCLTCSRPMTQEEKDRQHTFRDYQEASFYVGKDGRTIFKHPVHNPEKNSTTMGFKVCVVDEYVDANHVCEIMNRGDLHD